MTSSSGWPIAVMPPVHRHHAARLDVGGGLRGLFGEHVVVGPSAVVLAVLDEGDAKVRKASADFGKVRAVGRIAAVVNPLAAVLQHKAAPETSGPIAQTAARRVQRRRQRDAQVAALCVLPPVQFGDGAVRHAQRLQVRTQSQRPMKCAGVCARARSVCSSKWS